MGLMKDGSEYMDFKIVINQIIVLFLLMLCGYTVRRLKVINGQVIKGLSSLLLKVTLPALIISSMQLGELSPSVVKDLLLLVLISLCIFGIAILFALFIPKLLKAPEKDYGLYQFILVFANVGFLGYPLVEAILGREALFYTAIFNLPFNFLVYTLGYYYMSKNSDTKIKIGLKTFINPGVVAVCIGLVLLIFGIKLPYALDEAITSVGNLTTPLSMLIVGGLLVNINLKDVFGNYRLYITSAYRMIVFPLMIYFLMSLIFRDSLSRYMMAIPVIISALPVAVNAAIIAEEWEQDANLASTSIFISTLLCLITIPTLMFLLFG